MTVGHLLEDPWKEAANLQQTIAHGVSMFKILWQAKPNEARFDNLREWVTIAVIEVKTNLKALELFMRLWTKEQQNGPRKSIPPTTNPFEGNLAPLGKGMKDIAEAGPEVDTAAGQMRTTPQKGNGGLVLHMRETIDYAATGPDIDTTAGQMTLTPRAGDRVDSPPDDKSNRHA